MLKDFSPYLIDILSKNLWFIITIDELINYYYYYYYYYWTTLRERNNKWVILLRSNEPCSDKETSIYGGNKTHHPFLGIFIYFKEISRKFIKRTLHSSVSIYIYIYI